MGGWSLREGGGIKRPKETLSTFMNAKKKRINDAFRRQALRLGIFNARRSHPISLSPDLPTPTPCRACRCGWEGQGAPLAQETCALGSLPFPQGGNQGAKGHCALQSCELPALLLQLTANTA